MLRSMRIWAAALVAVLAVTRVDAAEPLPAAPPPVPPPSPIFFLHVGALGAFFQTDAKTTGGGFFNNLPVVGGLPQQHIGNAAIRPNYTLGIEFGLFLTPNIALAISAGIPPVLHAKATGFTLAYNPAAVNFGTSLLGSSRWGPAMLLLQYHFNQFGAFQPYAGLGPVYLLNFGNIADGILVRNFSISQEWGFALQAGFNYMITPNIGIFVDGKKVWLSTDVTGTVVGTDALYASGIPIRTHVQLDPWVASTGLTLKF